jgi:hypothetical protein
MIMQIVIELDDEMYKQISTNIDVYVLDEVDFILIENAIANGTPLPKGHGRLIDADALNLDYEVEMADDWKTAHEIANCVKYAPTIIEADEEE